MFLTDNAWDFLDTEPAQASCAEIERNSAFVHRCRNAHLSDLVRDFEVFCVLRSWDIYTNMQDIYKHMPVIYKNYTKNMQYIYKHMQDSYKHMQDIYNNARYL